MQKAKKGMLVALVAVVGITSVGIADADARRGRGADDGVKRVSVSTSTAVLISREQAIAAAQAVLSGTVRKAKLEREHGKKTWKVRIISTDGTKRGDFRIDASNGNILRTKIKNFR